MTYMQTGTDEDSNPDYVFQRQATEPTDTLSHGVGNPARRVGLIRSAFRPSDDATTYQFLVPANAMAVVELRRVATLLRALPASSLSASVRISPLADKAEALAQEVDDAIRKYAVVVHPAFGSDPIFAYEVDGFGNHLFMDDANVPSLLSLPYLGYVGTGAGGAGRCVVGESCTDNTALESVKLCGSGRSAFLPVGELCRHGSGRALRRGFLLPHWWQLHIHVAACCRCRPRLVDNATYQRTREAVLGPSNPW
jgi:hypothetical protein